MTLGSLTHANTMFKCCNSKYNKIKTKLKPVLLNIFHNYNMLNVN